MFQKCNVAQSWEPSNQTPPYILQSSQLCNHDDTYPPAQPLQPSGMALHTLKTQILNHCTYFLLVGMFYLSMSFKPKYKTKCKRKVAISLILQYKEQLQDEKKGEETRLLKMYNCYPNANKIQIFCRGLYCTYGFKIIKRKSPNTK